MRTLGVIGWAAIVLGINSHAPTSEAIGLQGSGFRIGQDGSRHPLMENQAPAEYPAGRKANVAPEQHGSMERFVERRSQSEVVDSMASLRGTKVSASDSDDFAGSAAKQPTNADVQPAFKVARSLGICNCNCLCMTAACVSQHIILAPQVESLQI